MCFRAFQLVNMYGLMVDWLATSKGKSLQLDMALGTSLLLSLSLFPFQCSIAQSHVCSFPFSISF